ncbi:MAG: hypothetical protein HZA28_08995 [Candidatus Omnitrophica bacterium]|nr:hypothetical protein [Candidatus Omnitrophota bacterium]
MIPVKPISRAGSTMSDAAKLTRREQDLIRRYLVWCYKTTKEDLDRVDRYFTQALADDFLAARLAGRPEYKAAGPEFRQAVDDFIQYAHEKKTRAEEKKFTDTSRSVLRPDYQYLRARLEAIEGAICHFFDRKELDKIALFYEKEMTDRILQAREHT